MKPTRTQKIQEQNRLKAMYRREAQALGIASPFKQSLYINARLNGEIQEQAKQRTVNSIGERMTNESEDDDWPWNAEEEYMPPDGPEPEPIPFNAPIYGAQ